MSATGRAWLTREEGYRTRAYRDTEGNWTTGVGHLIGPDEQDLITRTLSEDEVDALLRSDLATAEAAVSATRTKLPLLQDEFDALVHLVFNIGAGAYAGSTLKRRLEEGASPASLREAWLMWNRPSVLIPRRRREWRVFATASYMVATVLTMTAAALLLLAASKS